MNHLHPSSLASQLLAAFPLPVAAPAPAPKDEKATEPFPFELYAQYGRSSKPSDGRTGRSYVADVETGGLKSFV